MSTSFAAPPPSGPTDVTLSEILAELERNGYAGQFSAHEGPRIRCHSCRTSGPASEFSAERMQRVEGPSDPADMLAVAGLTCPWCRVPGALVLNYGPEATLEQCQALRDLEDERSRQVIDLR